MVKGSIAIVYDWMDKWGGVERVLSEFGALFPQADYYTSATNFKTAPWAKKLHPKTTFLQRLPTAIRGERKYLIPAYPPAFESMDLRGYKVVLSVTSSFAKSVITHPGTTHVCYLLTPTRFLWSHTKDYLSNLQTIVTSPVISHIKQWDLIASQRPDAIVSISHTVQKRCEVYYKRASQVVYPPFNSDHWDEVIKNRVAPKRISIPQHYFLFVGRMEYYKMPHLIIDVAQKLSNKEFVFVGTGSLIERLKNKSPKNCHFVDFVTDYELSYLYANADALLFPQDEDFGYVSLEAQYHGCPVVAFRQGGVCETVIEGQTGVFFDSQSAPSLIARLETYSKISYNLKRSTQAYREQIKKRFGNDRFRKEFLYQLENALV